MFEDGVHFDFGLSRKNTSREIFSHIYILHCGDSLMFLRSSLAASMHRIEPCGYLASQYGKGTEPA